MAKYHRLRDLREDNDLSIRALAEKLYMNKNTYHNYELGKREPPLDVMIQLSKLYGVSIDYMAGISDNPSISQESKLSVSKDSSKYIKNK